MNKKQITGMIIAAVIIIVTGITGIASNVISEKFKESAAKKEEQTTDMFSSLLDSGEVDIDAPDGPYIGRLDIIGTIQGSTSDTLATGDTSTYNHNVLMKFVDEMEKDSNNKGILLYVDSPGGTVYHSDELYLKLMEYKEKTKRPIYAYFVTEACSGGYYISMAADKIYANRNCMTGSIGVIMSMYNYSELFKKVGVEEIDITSGANKAMGSGGLEMTEEQKEILQSMVDEAYDQFTGIVSEGRNMDINTVKKLADGRIYTALQAKENNLIDEIGSLDDLKAALEEADGVGKGVEYYKPEGDTFSDIFSSILGEIQNITKKSDVQIVQELINNPTDGVLMYYAK
ncbi:MAG: signal peptide peptidase SppA [Lachnospiraceae bacterium]|nr:signal peptide peptidase SppA [Lachnospiraceae bacterium]